MSQLGAKAPLFPGLSITCKFGQLIESTSVSKKLLMVCRLQLVTFEERSAQAMHRKFLLNPSCFALVAAALALGGCGPIDEVDEGTTVLSLYNTTSRNGTSEVIFGSFLTADDRFRKTIQEDPIVKDPVDDEEPLKADPRFCAVAWDYYQKATSFINEKLLLAERYPAKAIEPAVAEEINGWAKRVRDRLKEIRARLESQASQYDLPAGWIETFQQAEQNFEEVLAAYNSAVAAKNPSQIGTIITLFRTKLDGYLKSFLTNHC